MAKSTKTILNLTTKDFFTGLSIAPHADDRGIWSEAKGINSFVDIDEGPDTTNDIGILQTGADFQFHANLTAVAGTPMASTQSTHYSTNGSADVTKLYWVTDEGFVGRTDGGNGFTGGPTTNELRAATNSAALLWPGTGLETLKTTNSGTLLFYFHSLSGSSAYNHSAAIGAYGPLERALEAGANSATFTDVFHTSAYSYTAPDIANQPQTQITPNRPTHKAFSKIYHATGYKVGSIALNSSGDPVPVMEDLDLPRDEEATALEDDGDFLIIASTKNSATYDSNSATGATVWFWDTFSADISRSWTIRAPYIIALKRVGGVIYALTPGGLWAFNYQTRPVLVRKLDNADHRSIHQATISYGGKAYDWMPCNTMAEAYGNLYWGGHDTINMLALADTNPRAKGSYHQPVTDTTAASGDITVIDSTVQTPAFFVGGAGANGEAARVNMSASGSTGVTAQTVYIPLKKTYEIQAIEIIFAEPLASGDDLFIDVQTDEDATENVDGSSWGTISFATYGAVRKVTIYNRVELENLKLLLTFNGGNVKIKNIKVLGHPTEL